MWLDYCVAAAAVPLALWLLASGLDDLFVGLVWLLGRVRSPPWPSDEELESAPERPIAILVPLWHEHHVIASMLEGNLAGIAYENYHIFAGVYPNDEATARVVAEVAARHPRVHLCVAPHDGPTSKADCLNAVWRRVRAFEREQGLRFEVVVTHDAEDIIHRRSLRIISWFSREYAMVQMPVLPLRMAARRVTHGLYCDEFAELQLKDLRVRQRLGGFLPGNGVGTGLTREALERLAPPHQWRVFDPECLTEDYDMGFRLHALGFRQLLVEMRFEAGGPVATREYFPATFRTAVRQRSRWVAGIALQGWERHGWRVPWRQVYWLWRDRKGLMGNLISPAANLLSIYGGLRWGRLADLVPHWVAACFLATFLFSLAQMNMRIAVSARVYGWRFALGVPVRTVWGNLVNCVATAAALRQFFEARLKSATLAWNKTEHAYPAHYHRAGRPLLGEVLVRMRWAAAGDIEEVLPRLPAGERLGEYLVRCRRLSEDRLYRALSLQTGIPVGMPAASEVDPLATRILPAAAARRWKAMAYRVELGQLHVATAEVPSEAMTGELAQFSSLGIRYRLIRPEEFERLAGRYLPEPAL